MIKAHYSPATEDLVEQVIEAMRATGAAPETRPVTLNVIEILKKLGYEISIEVEVHGDMATAIESLAGGTANYVTVKLPRRRKHPDTCSDNCPDHVH